MRITEKAIEVNFCCQLTPLIGPQVWWFGLTQRQEAQAGWDVASKIAGRWVRFQIKASQRVLVSTRCRRFETSHHQLVELQDRAWNPGMVFYVLPTIGMTQELMRERFELLPVLRFLDVYDIPSGLGPPTTVSGSARKNERHYLDLHPSGDTVTIRSEPVVAPVLGEEGAVERIMAGGPLRPVTTTEPVPGEELGDAAISDVRGFLESGRNRVAAFIPDGN